MANGWQICKFSLFLLQLHHLIQFREPLTTHPIHPRILLRPASVHNFPSPSIRHPGLSSRSHTTTFRRASTMASSFFPAARPHRQQFLDLFPARPLQRTPQQVLHAARIQHPHPPHKLTALRHHPPDLQSRLFAAQHREIEVPAPQRPAGSIPGFHYAVRIADPPVQLQQVIIGPAQTARPAHHQPVRIPAHQVSPAQRKTHPVEPAGQNRSRRRAACQHRTPRAARSIRHHLHNQVIRWRLFRRDSYPRLSCPQPLCRHQELLGNLGISRCIPQGLFLVALFQMTAKSFRLRVILPA